MLRTAQEKLIELAFICVIATATLVGWVVVRGVQKATDARADVAFGCVIVAAVLAAWVKWVLYVWGEEKRLAVEAERHDIGIPIDLTTRPRMAATRKAVKNGAGLQAHDQTRARHVEQVAEITQQLRSTFNDLELGGTPPGPSNRPPEVGDLVWARLSEALDATPGARGVLDYAAMLAAERLERKRTVMLIMLAQRQILLTRDTWIEGRDPVDASADEPDPEQAEECGCEQPTQCLQCYAYNEEATE